MLLSNAARRSSVVLCCYWAALDRGHRARSSRIGQDLRLRAKQLHCALRFIAPNHKPLGQKATGSKDRFTCIEEHGTFEVILVFEDCTYWNIASMRVAKQVPAVRSVPRRFVQPRDTAAVLALRAVTLRVKCLEMSAKTLVVQYIRCAVGFFMRGFPLVAFCSSLATATHPHLISRPDTSLRRHLELQ